jgi:hypothetical protein
VLCADRARPPACMPTYTWPRRSATGKKIADLGFVGTAINSMAAAQVPHTPRSLFTNTTRGLLAYRV